MQKIKFSKGFGHGYDFFMYLPEKLFLNSRRRKLLSGLKGKVLEVGVGTGINFKYYRSDVELIGIEPSPYMFNKAIYRRNKLVNPNRVTLHNIGCSFPEMEDIMVAESLDVVVCTLVLCTVPEPEYSLQKFKKWLKPGGKLIVLEHIRDHKEIGSKIQDKIHPYWEKFGEGCQINRPTDKMIAEAGFDLQYESMFRIGIPFYEAIFRK